jgi:hypothetical protein
LTRSTESALAAVQSGSVVPSNRWRAHEVVRAAEATGTRAARSLREAYEELLVPR